jgi:anti-sigma factor RsiW
MTEVTETDWKLLNAYHDGELALGQRAELERRISASAALAAALAEIRSVSSALKGLRPEPVAQGRGRYFRPLAIAASITLALLVTGAVYNSRPGAPVTAAAWHAEFLSQSYPAATETATGGGLVPAGYFGPVGAPDLSLANLTLVDQRQGRNGALALHYAGRNGCRLTVTAGFGTDMLTASDADIRSRFWSVGSVDYLVLANGMDPARFAAIASYIRQLAERSDKSETVLAMRKATKDAVPCTAGNIL